MIRFDPLVYLILPVLLLTLPLDWLLSALLAAAIHELCHLAALYVLKAKVYAIRIGAGGAVIEADFRSNLQELLCTLAGPAGSFMLVALYRFFPKLALCAGIQGLFNLLPIFPLDGGRAVRCCLELLCPGMSGSIEMGIEITAVLLVAAAAIAGTLLWNLGIMPLVTALVLIIKVFCRKRPCKQGKNRVQ